MAGCGFPRKTRRELRKSYLAEGKKISPEWSAAVFHGRPRELRKNPLTEGKKNDVTVQDYSEPGLENPPGSE